MRKEDIRVSFIGMEVTDSLKTYSIQKVLKHEGLIERATSIDILLKDNVNNKGVSEDFEFEIKVILPKGTIYVSEVGAELYSLIDKASDVLYKRLKRYSDKSHLWEGRKPWKVLEHNDAYDADMLDEEMPDYSAYVPRVTTREKMFDMRPMEEAEAIEQMELMGRSQFLFKNINTNKISMIYKKRKDDYGLIEPEDGVS
jgi:putative sigma-54 modulation protein